MVEVVALRHGWIGSTRPDDDACPAARSVREQAEGPRQTNIPPRKLVLVLVDNGRLPSTSSEDQWCPVAKSVRAEADKLRSAKSVKIKPDSFEACPWQQQMAAYAPPMR